MSGDISAGCEWASWQDRAACLGLPQELFFATVEESRPRKHDPPYDEGRRVCARCEVREECLDYAIRTNQGYGLWGGCNVTERNRLRRVTRRSA